MKDMTGKEVRLLAGSMPVVKKPVPVVAEFASTPGVLHTLEGPVGYEQGDAILTGIAGERWPMQRTHFCNDYLPIAPTEQGENGTYRKRGRTVWALAMTEAFTVTTNGYTLTGAPEDWLLQYGPNEYGIVAADIFQQTYSILPHSP
ncbi:PGDYG domain-containing protein [Desulfovibrio sp. OttesenSCG-928-G15]|nr:PGDYG domain-containing protein [Desulfovibrio sp. OttesenSCG-928-G15]